MVAPTPPCPLQTILDDFSCMDSWMDRYQYLIDLGAQLPKQPADWYQPSRLIRGCQSQVWMDGHLEHGRVQFHADSDAAIVKGLVGTLLAALNNRTPEDVLATSPEFLRAMGLDQHLSPTRSNGLWALWQAMQAKAERLSSAQGAV